MGGPTNGQIRRSENPGSVVPIGDTRGADKKMGGLLAGGLERPHVSRLFSTRSDSILSPDEQLQLGSFVAGILQELASVEKLSWDVLFSKDIPSEHRTDGQTALQTLIDWGFVKKETGKIVFLALPADVRAEVHEILRGPWDGLGKAKPVK